ncbi:phage head closure protein [Microvirga sp. Mcv34]|uniref:phage head closure protein n=1 Tax=Microvirga sp. Mcv34 TaxID=2926016 RepID=UPI0021C77125|nr:phage head closure protein [Microvirga sp. Mcv34]
MPKASQLRERITLQRRGSTQDEYGNEQTGAWENVFTIAANIAPARGREEVLAQRLQGVRPVEITVRWSQQTQAIDPSWRLINTRRPAEIYNIHDTRDPDGRKQWNILTCSLGTAT